ncbi:MAG: APC family permease [Gammaproteobacteria bacterium]|jgi:basic amino acid/polyamine antiporter, APA family
MQQETGLKRVLGAWLLTLYGLGCTIGAGIYALAGKIAGHAGYQAPLSFLVAAVLAGFSALSFAELAGRYPQSAGEAAYVRQGLRLRWLSVLTGLLVVLIGVISTASLLRGLAGYVTALLPVGEAVAILLVILLLAMLAIWGIKESVLAAALITLVEIGGLLLIVAVGLWSMPPEMALPPLLPEHIDRAMASGILGGAFLAFYAMIGFEDMVNVAEEVRNVQRNMRIAILLTLVITTLLYMAVTWVALAWVPPAELAATDAPMALVYERASGRTPVAIGTIAVLAVVNGGLILLIMASRVLYGMSRMRQLPSWFGQVHARTRTPVNAILFLAVVIGALALLFPLEQLARATAGIALTVFSLVNLSLVRVKLRGEQAPAGVMSVPLAVPVTGFLVSFGFVLWEIAS